MKTQYAIHKRERHDAAPVWDVMKYHPEPHHTAWTQVATFYDPEEVKAYARHLKAPIHPSE